MKEIKEHPILFSGEMVRAILEGRKTQTRRVISPQLPNEPTKQGRKRWGLIDEDFYYCGRKCPYGKLGDRLWVREAWQYAATEFCTCPQPSEASPCDGWSDGTGCYSSRSKIVYRCDQANAPKWRPSIHMPRWASRITLEVVSVRVERLHDISEEDAAAEGFEAFVGVPARERFISYWNVVNAKRGYGWNENPWVWVVEFKTLKPEI